ncbi:SRPBCC family protein [Lacinutrix jangbogonensis]|uniref:SRPBCC family protein n=1 Tax=Lacinutrix jangbogonensis TaxID=1469557 RepID=UPI00053D40F1|nr:SRPBCC family protein [Lacinutrix jangbogonensis]
MKAIKYIFFLILIAIIALAIYIAVQPNEFSVTRTRTINAPAAVIYNNVNDYKNWASWSSWVEKDPEIKIILPELTKGDGSSYTWQDKNGLGTMRTVETNANKSISQIMQIGEYPESQVSWKFKPNADGATDVTWNISGKNLPFDFKTYNAFNGGMEKQIGPDYERSLEKLDSIVISDMKKFSIVVDKETTQHSGGFYIYNTAETTFQDFQTKMTTMLPEVIAYANKNNITMSGAPYILYHKWDEANNAIMFSCCVPTTSRVITTGGEILTGQLAPFKAVKTTLNGDYSHLKEAWEKAMKAINDSGLEQNENGPTLEAYLNTPINTPNPADLKTEIYIAVK